MTRRPSHTQAPDKTRARLPLSLLVSDIIGTGLIALGLAAQFGNVHILPPQLQFENYAAVFIVVGIILSIPSVIHILRTSVFASKD